MNSTLTDKKSDRKLLEQAFASAHTLSEEQKRKRIQAKLERARHQSEQLKLTQWWQIKALR